MFERLRQLFSRRKNKKSFTKKSYPSPPPSFYRKSFEFPPDPDQSFRTPKMAKICIEDNAHLFNQFEISRIPTFQMRSSGWKSSKPYSQNATRFRFHGSYNRFRTSRCSNQGFRSSRCSSQEETITKRPSKKPPTYNFQNAPRSYHSASTPRRARHHPKRIDQNYDFSN